MKTPITQTELNAMPDVAWRKFCDFLLDKEIEFTPIQKTTALCLRYYFVMQGDGHAGVFDYFEDFGTSKLAQAFIDIGVPEFAPNLTEAIENGSHDRYKMTDAWFFDNENTLLKAIDEIRQNNIDAFYEIVDEDYTVIPPKDGFWVGAMITAVTFVFGIIAAMTNPNPDDRFQFLIITITGLVATGLILLLYAKRWKISVKKDVVTFRSLFRKKRTIRIGDFSEARKFSQGIILFYKAGRLVKIRKDARQFTMFWAQLHLAEKIADIQKVKFQIHLLTATIVTAFIFLPGCIWAFIWTFQRDYNPVNIYEKIFFSAALIVSLWYAAHCLLWRVIVSENSITVKKAFRFQTDFQIADITQVNMEKNKLIIRANDKIAVKVTEACTGYSDLIQKLQSTNIPFYRNGRRWNYENIPITEQLAVLADFGIKAKHDDFTEWFASEWKTDVVTIDPYRLLMILGSVRKSKDAWERLSDDVYALNTVCVEGNHSYPAILEKLAALSKETFSITNIQSDVDPEKKKASVSFDYHNKKQKWKLEYHGNWFDSGILWKINDLLKSGGSEQFFYASNPPDEQVLTIVFCSDEVMEKLNLLTDYPFVKAGADKMTSGFTVKQNRSNIKGSLFTIAVFGGTAILMLVDGGATMNGGDKMQNLAMSVALSAFLLLSFYFLTNALRWRLVVADRDLSLRKIIGSEKTYAVKSITRVDVKTESIRIHINEKKIRVAKNCVNFPLLIARLEEEKIPFHFNGGSK